MYNYIVTSYMRNVPKQQRYGITLWGLLDNQSWRYKSGADYPLIYNASGTKKKAYEGVLNALKSGLQLFYPAVVLVEGPQRPITYHVL